ncbi:MAG: hypothetical protein U0744_10720 [Gemmataceae bacterium]
MRDIVGEWIKREVNVTLRLASPITLQGLLLDADDTGVLLQLPQSQTFIPVTSILHVSLLAK